MDSLGVITIILQLIIFIVAVVIHEYAHAYTAYKCGDPTPKVDGRLSLNPLKHLDPIGLVLLFIVGIGFAKPVSINPGYFYNRMECTRKVALAGPLINIITALIAGLLTAIFPVSFLLNRILNYVFYINLGLGIFNLIPLWPLDGHHILLAFCPKIAINLRLYRQVSIILLLILFFTNLINYVVFIPVEFIHFLISSTF